MRKNKTTPFQNFKIYRFFVLVVICASLGACQSVKVYKPSSHFVPLLEDAGDIFVSANKGSGVAVGAAINVTNDLGLGFYSSELNSIETITTSGPFSIENKRNYEAHSYRELLLIYNPFENKDNLKHEFMLSYGRGHGKEKKYECIGPLNPIKVNNNCGDGTDPEFEFALGEYNKISLQYNIASESRFIESGASLKMSYLNFYSLDQTENLIPMSYSDTHNLFFEPAAFARFGTPTLKVEFQTGIIVPLNEPVFNYSGLYVSIGLHLNIHELFLNQQD